MYTKILSVSALNNYLKKTIDADFILNNLNIRGEISNFKMHSSGHLYFSLKDENSKVNCIMFRSYSSSLNFTPKDGSNVVVRGKLSVYEKDGSYQIYCYSMVQEGIGELHIAFQELKAKLEKQGLFAEAHKKPIPEYPRRIGVITSPTGAAIRDIINVARRRNKSIELLIYPALVQGEKASEDIIKGIYALNNINDIDVIILARGGGSIEELWAFNDEKLAQAVFNSKRPIITGVGHETDFTIVDFVSDRRAPTPSAAAEIAVPRLEDINNKVLYIKEYLETALRAGIIERQRRIELLNKTLDLHSPMNYLINQYNYIDRLQSELTFKISSKVNSKKEQLSRLYALMGAHNPLKVLNKGYALIEDLDGNIISERSVLKIKEAVKITLKDGRLKAKIHCFDET